MDGAREVYGKPGNAFKADNDRRRLTTVPSCIIEEARKRVFHRQGPYRTCMKTGIIGLPQVGKTSLFKDLTKAKLEERGHSRQEHIGVGACAGRAGWTSCRRSTRQRRPPRGS